MEWENGTPISSCLWCHFSHISDLRRKSNIFLSSGSPTEDHVGISLALRLSIFLQSRPSDAFGWSFTNLKCLLWVHVGRWRHFRSVITRTVGANTQPYAAQVPGMSTPATSRNLRYLRVIRISRVYHHTCWSISFKAIVIPDVFSVKIISYPRLYSSLLRICNISKWGGWPLLNLRKCFDLSLEPANVSWNVIVYGWARISSIICSRWNLRLVVISYYRLMIEEKERKYI
jgi:hypothetical protein